MVAILNNIRSLHNVGSIFRTADAAGMEKLYLTGITPSPLDQFGKIRPQVAKVSLGAERYVTWDDSARSPRAVLKLLARLKSEGYKIFATEQDKKAIPYYQMKPFSFKEGSASGGDYAQGKNNSKIALIFGNEVSGLPKTILAASDKILEIPMLGRKESLNVAVSFGVIAFHLAYKVKKRLG